MLVEDESHVVVEVEDDKLLCYCYVELANYF